MRGTAGVRLLLFAAGMVCFAVPALILDRLLAPQGPLWVLYAYGALVEAIFLLHAVAADGERIRLRRAASIVLALVLVAGSAVVLADILIVPNSAYFTWFRLAAQGNARGTVSAVFIVTSVYFAIVIGGLLQYRPFTVAALGLLLDGALTAAIISGHATVAAAAVAIGALALILLGGRRLPARSRFAMLPSALLFCACVVGIGFASRALFSSAGNRFVDTDLSPSLRAAMLRLIPDFPLLYAIPGYGYSFDSRPLGSEPVLSDQTIFHVRAPANRTIYLRASVLDRYSGGGWSLSGAALKEAREAAGGLSTLYDPSLTSASGDEISVKVAGDFYSYLPGILDEAAFGFVPSADRSGHKAGGGLPEALETEYGDHASGYLLRVPLVRGDTIIIKPGRRASPEPSPDALKRYLEVPDSLAVDVRQAAGAFGPPPVGAAQELSRADEIRRYIQDRTTYALETEEPPRGTGLVEYFLFGSRSGYCVHYATAFIVLARLNGIPARYASGFLVNMPSDGSERDVSGLAAHAWPEIYLPGTGWTIFEVTPPVEAGRYGDSSYYAGLERDRLMYRQLRALMGDRIPEIAPAPRKHPSPRGRVPLWLAAPPALLGACLLLFFGIRRRLGSAATQFRSLCAVIASRVWNYDVDPPTRLGWTAWQAAAARRVTLRARGSRGAGSRSAKYFRRLARIAQRRFFGGETVTRRDVKFARGLARRIPRRLRRRTSRPPRDLDTHGAAGSL